MFASMRSFELLNHGSGDSVYINGCHVMVAQLTVEAIIQLVEEYFGGCNLDWASRSPNTLAIETEAATRPRTVHDSYMCHETKPASRADANGTDETLQLLTMRIVWDKF
jgi:hypothetical protein